MIDFMIKRGGDDGSSEVYDVMDTVEVANMVVTGTGEGGEKR